MKTQHNERTQQHQVLQASAHERWQTRTPHQAPARSGVLIGLDCDGVLASDRLLWQVLRKRYPAQVPARYEQLAAYDWPRATAETTELCLRLSADPGFAGRLAPMPQMAETLLVLSALGYRFHIITARPDCVTGATRRWLARQGVDACVEAISCVARPLDKVTLVRELGCVAFVEDNHTTAEALGRAGIRSYLLDAPYNRLPAHHSVRVRGWPALAGDLRAHVPLPAIAPAPSTREHPRAARRDGAEPLVSLAV